MPITLTNLTGSRANVPYSAGAQPRYVLAPNACVEIPDEYLTSLDSDAQSRFLRVTSEPNPIFRVSSVASNAVAPEQVLTEQERDLLSLGQSLAPEPVESKPSRKGRK